MHQTKVGLSVLILLIVLCVMSCNPSKNAYSSNPEGGKAEESPRILFLDYQLSRDSATKTLDAKLISMIMRDGTIKDARHKAGQARKDDLELLVLDRNQQIMTQRHIPNPLDRSVEYVNNARQFERIMIHLDSVQFSIRLQLESGASSIMLNRLNGENIEGTLLINTQIQ